MRSASASRVRPLARLACLIRSFKPSMYGLKVPLAREGVAVRRERAVENAIPRELGAGTGAPGVAHPTPEVTVPEQLGERGAKRGDVPRRNEQARLLVHDQVEQAADGGGDDRPAVRHR